jgi:DNA invertase Pin-like site-specific DNA recombinase
MSRGETVVCVHGVPTSGFLYRKLLPELASRGLEGANLDLRIGPCRSAGRFRLLAAIAEFERELIRERTGEGQRRVRLNGTAAPATSTGVGVRHRFDAKWS